MNVILVCLLALSALAFALPFRHLKINAIQRKFGILGTKLAHIQNYPYTVSTYSDHFKMISGTGVILNHNWILTTTTQLYKQSVDDVTIRGGSDDGQTGGQSSKIAKIITNYTGYWKTDIALLKTKTKLVFNKYLKPAKLAKFLPKEGSLAVLSGFGKNEIRSGVLSAGNFKISSYSECKNYYNSDTIFCAKSDVYMPTFDDYGAPLVQKKQLVGYYNGVDRITSPLTFMPIAKLREWIIQTIRENSDGDEIDGIDVGDADFDTHANDEDDDDDDDTKSDSDSNDDDDNGAL